MDMIDATTLTWKNEQTGKSQGIEVSSEWRIAEKWRVSSSYTWMDMSLDGGNETYEESTPANQFQIRSYMDITRTLEINSAIYYYDPVPQYDIPSLTRLDIGVTWRPKNNMEIRLWGQNLSDREHQEYGDDPIVAASTSEIQRCVYGSLSYKF